LGERANAREARWQVRVRRASAGAAQGQGKAVPHVQRDRLGQERAGTGLGRMSAPAAGRVIDGKYRLLEPSGSGGMGSVWKAEHLSLRSLCAVKLMHRRIAGADALERFVREARAAAALRSPHVVSVLDSGVSDETPYVVMELLEGEALD